MAVFILIVASDADHRRAAPAERRTVQVKLVTLPLPLPLTLTLAAGARQGQR
jgi:hypothetical protein